MGTSNRSGEAGPKEEEDEEMEGGDAAETERSQSDGSGLPDPSSPPPFSEGEKVLAFHGPRIYEAKVEPCNFFSSRVSFPPFDI